MRAGRTPQPPRFAEWLLTRCLEPDNRPLVLGDLEEQFHIRLADGRAAQATAWYWQEAVRLIWGLWWWAPHRGSRRRRILAMDDVRYAMRRLSRRPVAATVSVLIGWAQLLGSSAQPNRPHPAPATAGGLR